MGFIERFKTREAPDTIHTVPIALKSGALVDVFEFEVAEFSPIELDGARERAKASLVQRGIDVVSFSSEGLNEPTKKLLIEEGMIEIAETLKPHIKDWTHKPPDGEEPLSFTDENLETVWAALHRGHKFLVSTLYLAAVNAEGKKKAVNPSAAVSEKNSSDASPTTLQTLSSTAPAADNTSQMAPGEAIHATQNGVPHLS